MADQTKIDRIFLDMYNAVNAAADPEAEATRLAAHVGNRDHETAMAENTGLKTDNAKLTSDNAGLTAGNAQMAKGLKRSGRWTKTFMAATAVALAVVAHDYVKGPEVVVVDGPSSLDLIPPSMPDQEMLGQAFGPAAQLTRPMKVVAPGGTNMAPYLPYADHPFDTLAEGSCVYAFGKGVVFGNTDYAMVVRRADGVTMSGYIPRRNLQETHINTLEDQACKATVIPTPR